MSVICGEFVQNAWRKDLCSNCFKARADHSVTNGAPSDVPPLVAAPKMAPYVPFKRTVLSNGTANNNNNNKLTSNNNRNSSVQLTKGKLSSDQPFQRRIGSSGVHLWEVGPLSRDGREVGGLTNGQREGAGKPGILKDKPVSASTGGSRRSSVVFIDESLVIGYGGNDYDWEEDESSEEPSDVDSLDNFELTEEDKEFGEMTDRNTEYNADNTNLLLLNEASAFGRRLTAVHAVADRLNPKSFYSMPVKAGHGTAAAEETPDWGEAGTMPERDSDNAVPDWSGAVKGQAASGWSAAEIPERDSGKEVLDARSAAPLTASGKAEADGNRTDALIGAASDEPPEPDVDDAAEDARSAAMQMRGFRKTVASDRGIGEDSSAAMQSQGSKKAVASDKSTAEDKSSAAMQMQGFKKAVASDRIVVEDRSSAAPQMQEFKKTVVSDRNIVENSSAAPQMQGFKKAMASDKNVVEDRSSAAPQMRGFKTTVASDSSVVENSSTAMQSHWFKKTVACDKSTAEDGSPAAPQMHGLNESVASDKGTAEDRSSATSAALQMRGPNETLASDGSSAAASVIQEPQPDPDATVVSSDPQTSMDARCFIDSLFSAEGEPSRLSFLTSEESEEDAEAAVKRDSGLVHRAGIVTVPTRKHPATYRATVQKLFNEEPVTAAELRAVSAKLGSPPTSSGPLRATGSRSCSPYGVVPVSVVRPEGDRASSRPQDAPVIPSVPPPSSGDESQKYPFQPKPSTDAVKDSSLTRTGLGPCSTFHSPAQRDPEARFRNREYAAVQYSCHYASSYVSGGGATCPPLTTLPPTPLTNPYSSTAILKGIPRAPERSPPQKPRPLTKPKPKLPVKPVVTQRRASEEASEGAAEAPRVQNGSAVSDRASVCYQEVDGEDLGRMSSFESKVVSLGNALDFGKRTPKRKAPRPPAAASGGRTKEQGADHDVASGRSSDRNPGKAGAHTARTAVVADQHRANQGSDHTPVTDQGPSEPMPNEGHSSSRSSSYTLGTNLVHQRDTPLFRENGKPKKSKFSLKKLLKFGSSSSSKDDGEEHRSKGKGLHHHSNGSGHERRTKLEILHPIDLINSAASEVTDRTSDSGPSSKTSSLGSRQGDEGHVAELKDPGPVDSPPDINQPRYKPPPPPRSRSLAEESLGSKDKPSRPPPPTKRAQTLTRTPAVDNCSWDEPHQEEEASKPVLRSKENASGTAMDSEENRGSVYSVGLEYANLGDVRNNLAPKKPGRCSSNSMLDISLGCEMTNGEEFNASGSPKSLRGHNTEKLNGHSFGKAEVMYYAPPEEQQPSSRREGDAVDLEDLYADQTPVPSDQSPFSSINLDSLSSNSSAAKVEPQSAAALDKVCERAVPRGGSPEKAYAKMPQESSDPDEGDLPWPRRKSSRLSLRKTKTVVHKNLEDNYGAVVSANHQTLTQILEQVTLTQQANASKAKLLGEASPRWSDFRLTEESPVVIVGDKAFYNVTWQQNVELTLMVSQDPLSSTSHTTRNSCVLLPIVEFEDVLPCVLFPGVPSSEGGYRRGTVWVLDHTRVESLTSASESLRSKVASDAEALERESCFVLLQLINGLKHLQVLGIEEVDALATDFALTARSGDANHRLVILPPPSSSQKKKAGEKLSLCQSALWALLLLLLDDAPVKLDARSGEIPEAFRLIAEVLRQERATSLSRAKLLLEYLLWGPTDLQDFQGKEPTTDEELAYQRWLDLERATVLNNLIRTQSLWQIRLTVFEEYMLAFLVRTCAKTLRDAANQLRVKFGNAS